MANGQARFRQAVRRKESIAKSETFDCGICQTGRQAMYLASCLVVIALSRYPREADPVFASNRGTQQASGRRQVRTQSSKRKEEDPDRPVKGRGTARPNDSRPRQGTGGKKEASSVGVNKH
ncbi:hypothetical protein An05g00650 [Aspergillus niger]|uniref:Uncharacterized protein n=2 Tax=Aspergillus niger TaxID=5061 RepID=A2QKL9_ASPNC|nr:hypothetical protein An05g00650 [Aspergillus niger]CAK39102.1 hypothetical protein An05g00650 [Aspergillus niger]